MMMFDIILFLDTKVVYPKLFGDFLIRLSDFELVGFEALILTSLISSNIREHVKNYLFHNIKFPNSISS